jgi:hypothetical protein
MHAGPVIIGFDGTPASVGAVRESAALTGPRAALVVVVWEAGRNFELAAGRMSDEEFKRIEDRAVDQAIAMQEGCGLDVINDGELRRFSFLDHLLGDMEGSPRSWSSTTWDWCSASATGSSSSSSVR